MGATRPSAAGTDIADDVTEGGLAATTSASTRKRRVNHYSGFGPTCRLISSPEVGPGATVGTLKLGYPYYCTKAKNPRDYPLVAWRKRYVWDQATARPRRGRLLRAHNSARLLHTGGSEAATCPEEVIYSKASSVGPDPPGQCRTPVCATRTSGYGQGPPREQTGPLGWNSDPSV
jgi:hypothetical protein